MGPLPVCAYDMMVYDDEDVFMPTKKKGTLSSEC
jgi:hypothetical protein